MPLEFLRERYLPEHVENIRLRMQKDYANFVGGYPSYLNHISRVVLQLGTGLPISAQQIESYKTLQNFIEKGRGARIGTLRFLHAYLELSAGRKARENSNLLSLFDIGRQCHLKYFPDCTGKIHTQHNKLATRVYFDPSNEDHSVFGVLSDINAHRQIYGNGMPGSAVADKMRVAHTRHLAVAVSPSRDQFFDVLHVFYFNPYEMEAEFDEFVRRRSEVGTKYALSKINNDWIKDFLLGFAYWYGGVFEGFLATPNSEYLFKIRGFPHYQFDEDDFSAAKMGGILFPSDPFMQRVNCGTHEMTRWMNLEIVNLRTHVSTRPDKDRQKLKYGMSKKTVLPWDIGQFDPARKILSGALEEEYETGNKEDLYLYTFDRVLNSTLQLQQIGEPHDHSSNRYYSRTDRDRKAKFMVKNVVKTSEFDLQLNITENISW